MTYLLDTNVLSEMRKFTKARGLRARIDPHVAAWVQSVPASSLYLSVITILELEIGILLIERRDAVQGQVLRTWLDRHVTPAFDGRILAVDVAVAKRAATLHVPNPLEDRDALIAATAAVHQMTVVTRNIHHFERAGVPLFDPWQG